MNDWDKKPPLRPSEEGQSPIQVSILGDFVLSHADGSRFLVATKKNRALLAILALSPGSQATRERLCGLLWGDRGEDQARSSLRQSLAVLRKELGGVEDLVLKTHDDIVALRRDTAQVDAIDFLALSNDSGITTLRQAAKLYRGELLSDTSIRDAAFEDWLSAERSRLRTVAIKIFDRLIPLEEGHSRIVAAQQLVSFDPLRESSHRLLMQAYADQGDNGLALKQFELCRKLLQEELSVEPARETLELRRQIAEGERKSTKQENVRTEPAKVLQAEQFPSIAVLPFLNLSGDPQQDYFAEGIAEDIITELGRFSTLLVIGRNSSFRYGGGSLDVIVVGKELGVSYLVSGTVRRIGEKVRISAQLVDAKSGNHLWSERYDHALDKIFDVQDDVVRAVVATTEHRIADTETNRLRSQPASSWPAYDCFLRGRQLMEFYDRHVEAEAHLIRAITLSPSFSEPYSLLAHVEIYKYFEDGNIAHVATAWEWARQSLAFDDRNSNAHNAIGFVACFKRDFDLARYHIDRALNFNANNIKALGESAVQFLWTGKYHDALQQVDAILTRDPFPPNWYWDTRAAVLFQLRRYQEAIEAYNNVVDKQFWEYAYIIAAMAHSGKEISAKAQVAELQRRHPGTTIARIMQVEVYADEAGRQHLVGGLRLAGLPDGSLAKQTSSVNPGIAVLPFANLSDDTRHDYFSDGLTDDIITELAKQPNLFVIARESSFAFKSTSTELGKVADKLGVRFLLQGSVRRADNRIRVNVHLIDAISGGHLWADRFDRELSDIFATQDEIVGKIIEALTGKMKARGESKRYKPTNMEAFDLCMKGRRECWVSMEAGTRARETFRQVIALDPNYAEAWRWLALGNAMSWLHFGEPMEPARSESIIEAKKAVELDPHDPDARWVLSMILLYERQWEAAARESDLSIELNPNCADAWSFRSDLKVMDGKSEEALECAERAYLLDPFQPARNLWDLGQAQFASGQYAAAVKTLRKDAVYQTGARRILIAALAKLGRMEEAHEERQLYLADNPHFTIQFWIESQPFRDLAMRDRFIEAYRLAGLPEIRRFNSHAQSEKPSIAVLPFANLSGDPQHDYFADGITEDITTELSRFKGLFVIARNSAFSFKAKSIAIAAIADELGVRFLLEGSVRRSGDRVRVTARLVDAATGREAWSERYDRVIEDIFAVQDDVVRTIVATLEGQLASTVASQSRRQTPSNILAYECVLQARKFLDVYDAQSAEPLLRRAVAADPRYAQAQAWMAMVYWVKFFQDHQDKDIAKSVASGKTGVALDPGDSVCHMQLGFAYIFARQLELADIHSLKALELNPADMLALGLRAQLLCRIGRSQEAIEALDQLVRHDPFPPNWYWENRSIVLLTLDKFEEALAAIQHMLELFWWNHCYVAVCCAGLGRIEEANHAVKRALELCPGLTIQRFMKGEPYKLTEDANRMIEGLRIAGLAEHTIASSARSGTKPSMAVLPFVNLSGDAQQDYLADGLAEDVIGGLNRFSSLAVISQNSSFRFRSGSTDAKLVGNELGVQYLVTGSLRRIGQRIRINTQLTDTASGVQLWSEKYERNVEDFQDVQDDVVRAIATTFEHRIADIRAQEISNKPAATWEAYDHFLQARQLMSRYSNYPAAEAPLLRAIALDPSFSEAHARLAHVAMSKYWAHGDRKHVEEAFRYAKTSIKLNDRDSAAHAAMSLASAFKSKYDLAFLHADRALELNPNNMLAAKNRAMWQVFTGKSLEALGAFDTILARDPYPTPITWEVKGAALFQLRRYEEAIKVFAMIPELQYWDRAYLIASQIRLGNNTEAKDEVLTLLRLHPEFSISRVFQTENYADEDSRDHLRNALLEAGLPENADSTGVAADH